MLAPAMSKSCSGVVPAETEGGTWIGCVGGPELARGGDTVPYRYTGTGKSNRYEQCEGSDPILHTVLQGMSPAVLLGLRCLDVTHCHVLLMYCVSFHSFYLRIYRYQKSRTRGFLHPCMGCDCRGPCMAVCRRLRQGALRLA